MSQRKPKRGKDGRYRLYYHGKQFVGSDLEEVKQRRQAYIKTIKLGLSSDEITFQQYAEMWLPDNKTGISDKTFNSYSNMLEKASHLLGKKKLSQITPSDIKHIYSVYFVGLSDSHIRHAKNLYTALFDSAVEDRICLSNPCRTKTATPAKGKIGTHRNITDEERAIIETTEARMRPFLMTMLYAGLRNSEALALDVDRDIDFKKKEIHVSHFLHADETGNQCVVTTDGKNKYAKRTVKLFPQLEAVLKDHHGLLLSNDDGKPVSLSEYRNAWRTYCNLVEKNLNGCQRRWYGKRVQDKGQTLPKWRAWTVRPYDLRHSFCTYCRDIGIEMHVLQSWMGHADLTMISRIYDHLTNERIEAEFKKVIKSAKNNTKNNTRRKVYRLKRLE